MYVHGLGWFIGSPMKHGGTHTHTHTVEDLLTTQQNITPLQEAT